MRRARPKMAKWALRVWAFATLLIGISAFPLLLAAPHDLSAAQIQAEPWLDICGIAAWVWLVSGYAAEHWRGENGNGRT